MKGTLKEMCKGAVEALVTCVVLVAILALGYKYCYHIDNQSFRLGDNYMTIEERLTIFGTDVAKWERKIPKEPMEFVFYEKWF